MLCDPQAKMVFRAETVFMSELQGEKAISSPAEARDWIAKICNDPRVSKKLVAGNEPALVIDFSRQRDATRGNMICLGREASLWSLTHELAHFITPPMAEPHGKAFCGNLLLVTQAAWGNSVARRLQACFDQFEVLYPVSSGVVASLPKAA